MKTFTMALMLGVCLALTACNSKPSIVGHWKVDPQMITNPPPGIPAAFMTGFASTFKFEFKRDNTYTNPRGAVGTYTLDGSKLSMTNKGLSGRTVQMTGELAADGQSLVLHVPGLGASQGSIKMVPTNEGN